MRERQGKNGKITKRLTEKPALTCAICGRRYQAIQTPGMHTIYSICPDCKMDGTQPGTE